MPKHSLSRLHYSHFHTFSLLLLYLTPQSGGQAGHASERVRVLYSKHLLTSLQSSPIHCFRLFVLALAQQHHPKVANAGERVGCFTPSTFSCPSRARWCIASDSSYLPWLDNSDPSWLTLVSVCRCFTPSTFSYPSRAHQCIASTSLYLPCLHNANPRLLILVSMSGCSTPSTSSLSTIAVCSIFSAVECFPTRRYHTVLSAILARSSVASSLLVHSRASFACVGGALNKLPISHTVHSGKQQP
jgi:hypothetical protein